MNSVKERRPAKAPAPIRLEIRAAHPDEADEKLNEAVQELQLLAAVERSSGILVTRTGVGRYTVELSRKVPYGFTEEAVA